jgi:hypothetical protein
MTTWKAVALGAVVAVTAPVTLPVAFALVRPFVKAATKQVLVGYEQARVRLALAAEALEDLVAEARAEARHAVESRRRAPAREPSPATGAEAADGSATAGKPS